MLAAHLAKTHVLLLGLLFIGGPGTLAGAAARRPSVSRRLPVTIGRCRRRRLAARASSARSPASRHGLAGGPPSGSIVSLAPQRLRRPDGDGRPANRSRDRHHDGCWRHRARRQSRLRGAPLPLGCCRRLAHWRHGRYHRAAEGDPACPVALTDISRDSLAPGASTRGLNAQRLVAASLLIVALLVACTSAPTTPPPSAAQPGASPSPSPAAQATATAIAPRPAVGGGAAQPRAAATFRRPVATPSSSCPPQTSRQIRPWPRPRSRQPSPSRRSSRQTCPRFLGTLSRIPTAITGGGGPGGLGTGGARQPEQQQQSQQRYRRQYGIGRRGRCRSGCGWWRWRWWRWPDRSRWSSRPPRSRASRPSPSRRSSTPADPVDCLGSDVPYPERQRADPAASTQ